MQACDRCHSRKTRCDRRLPSCTACAKAGTACLHRDKLRQRNLPRGYIDGVENRLQIITEENVKLREEVAALRSHIAAQEDGNPQNITTPQNAPDGYYNNTQHRDARSPGSQQNTTQSPLDDNIALEPQRSGASTSPHGDAVSTEVGDLSLKATGETRYIGSSSGIGLASIISNMVDDATGAPLLPQDPREENALGPQYITQASLVDSFPSRQSAMPFVEAYFQHTHITFPLLHRTSFLGMIDVMYNDESYYTSHTYDAFAFDMVLSIGSSNFNRFGDASAISAAHYARAKARLPTVLGLPGLTPLKAILLLSQHGIFSNLRDTSASIWHLIGIGVRICYEMGLHHETRRFANLGIPPSGFVTFQDEMKRRCFWCLYNLDRVVSFTLGRPAAIKDEDIDVSMPSNLDDSDFGPDKPITTHHINGLTTSPFLHLIRIRRLSGQILAAFYSAKPKINDSEKDRWELRHKFHEQLVAWKEDTKLLSAVSKSPREGPFLSCFLSEEWYSAVYNNAMLLLYRPSPSFPHPTTNLVNQSTEEGDLLLLFSAAKNTIHAYAQLHNKRRLNYSWITLHGVFIAGLAYVYCIGRALKVPDRDWPVPDYLEIINDTRACSNVLVAICERWNVVRRSCELFNNLSNAVIRDAVNATAKEPNRRPLANPAPPGQPPGRTQNDTNLDCDNMQRQFQEPHSFTGSNMDLNDLMDLDHVFVAEEFRHCSRTLDGTFTGDQTFPSELIMGFSHDWPFDDTFAQSHDYGMPMQQQEGYSNEVTVTQGLGDLSATGAHEQNMYIREPSCGES